MGVKAKKPTAKKLKAIKRTGSSARALPGVSTSGDEPVWHGSSEIEMQVGSPDVSLGDDGVTTTTLVYAGKYDDLETQKPDRGDEISGYLGTVRNVRLRGERGGRGTLTVVLKDVAASASDPSAEVEELSSRWEINWRSVEKPLCTNPVLVVQGSDTTQTAVDEVEAWRNSPQQRKRLYQIPVSTLEREADPNTDSDWVDLAGESLSVCKKIAAGIEGWLEFSPVIIKISIYSEPVTTGGCGKIGDPDLLIDGYKYLKTGDNLVQQANKEWQRTQTWEGSDKWDTDLYEDA